jgi:hypothetical protein
MDHRGDACLVISAVQDDDAKQYFDLDQQSTKARAAYRSQHLNGSSFKAAGLTTSRPNGKRPAATDGPCAQVQAHAGGRPRCTAATPGAPSATGTPSPWITRCTAAR